MRDTRAPHRAYRLFQASVLLLCNLFAVHANPSGGPESAVRILRGSSLFGTDPRFELSISMKIVERGGEKDRRMTVAVEQTDAGSSMLARIVHPAFLSNMKYLRVQKTGSAVQQWLKTSRGVMRVTGSGAGERIFGSHFTVEDFGETTEAEFELSVEEIGSGVSVIAAVPRDRNRGYRRKLVSADRSTGLITGVKYLDDNGKPVRTYTLEETQSIDGTIYPKRAVMRDERTGETTTLSIETVERPSAFPSRLFNPAGL